jgi:anti-sigma regulatory factor (Ser/Thr protein kinase)
VRLTLPAVAESVPEARGAIVAHARGLGASEQLLADIALAVSEACTNVVLHAYRGHDEPGTVQLSADLHDGMLEVLVADEGGQGIDAREDSPGLGMGMALMAAVATGLQLDHDGAATRVHLTFDLRVGVPAEESNTPLADRD